MEKNANTMENVRISWHAKQARTSASRLTPAMKTARSMNAWANRNALEVAVAVPEREARNAEARSTAKELWSATTRNALIAIT